LTFSERKKRGRLTVEKRPRSVFALLTGITKSFDF
jgi:hypothetical protein